MMNKRPNSIPEYLEDDEDDFIEYLLDEDDFSLPYESAMEP